MLSPRVRGDGGIGGCCTGWTGRVSGGWGAASPPGEKANISPSPRNGTRGGGWVALLEVTIIGNVPWTRPTNCDPPAALYGSRLFCRVPDRTVESLAQIAGASSVTWQAPARLSPTERSVVYQLLIASMASARRRTPSSI